MNKEYISLVSSSNAPPPGQMTPVIYPRGKSPLGQMPSPVQRPLAVTDRGNNALIMLMRPKLVT